MRGVTLLLILALCAPVGATEIPGWTLVPDTAESFGPDQLWEQINGGADAFLAYGFRELEYREIEAGELVVAVETYHMGSTLNAFGIYRLENAGVTDVGVGAAACIMAPYEARLLDGDRYLKLSAVEGNLDAGRARELLAALASPDAALPGELTLLPTEGRLAGSERYTREGYLGLKELRRCLHADYRLGVLDCVFFLMLPGEDETAAELAASLGKRWQPRESGNRTLFLRKVPYRGSVALALTERGLLGLSGIEDEDRLVERLQAAAP